MWRQSAQAIVRTLGYKVSRIQPPVADPPVDPCVTDLIRSMWPVAIDLPLFRAGGDADGAYIIPDDLEGIAALFSPGVDQVSQFEDDMARRGMRCYLADASVSGPAMDNPAFHFIPKFLGLADDDTHITLDSWVNGSEPGSHDLMLQMDIEGAEWAVLAHASDAVLARFRIIVVELHWISQLFERFPQQVIVEVLQRLLRTHHVVHNHPNNAAWILSRSGVDLPELLEVTFIRKDRVTPRGFTTAFPHPLDIVNMDSRPVLTLPESWHG